MNIAAVAQQMVIMLLFILIGYFFFKKGKLSEESSRHISGIVVNLSNPAALLCSAFDTGDKLSGSQLLTGLIVMVAIYAALLLAGVLMPKIMRSPKEENYIYHFLTVYGNVGFLGIPLVSAVLGNGALIYVSINVLLFNILFYTTGTAIIRQKAGVKSLSVVRDIFSRLVNVGTVSAVLTIVIYLADVKVSVIVSDAATYAGRTTTLLSMLVLGVALAQMPLKELISHPKDYLFIGLRFIALPILRVLILRRFVSDPLILGSAALLIAVPCGNLPMMCSKEYGLKTDTLARTIVLSTILSVITIPIVAMFV